MSSSGITAAPMITHAHVDLLVSGAARYGVLISPTTAAFSPACSARAGVAATGDEAGQLLLEQYRSALRWITAQAGGAVREMPPPYTHTQVGRFEPIEVVKAAHCYEHAVETSPGWPGSAAQRLVERLIRTATQRLPGYLEAAWEWTRPVERLAPPAGLCRTWRPVETGVQWVEPAALLEAWATASLFVVTVEALPDLPAGLGRRSGVYLCANGGVDERAWPLVEALLPDVLIMLPPGRPWLETQLNTPTDAYRRSPIYPSPSIPIG